MTAILFLPTSRIQKPLRFGTGSAAGACTPSRPRPQKRQSISRAESGAPQRGQSMNGAEVTVRSHRSQSDSSLHVATRNQDASEATSNTTGANAIAMPMPRRA